MTYEMPMARAGERDAARKLDELAASVRRSSLVGCPHSAWDDIVSIALEAAARWADSEALSYDDVRVQSYAKKVAKNKKSDLFRKLSAEREHRKTLRQSWEYEHGAGVRGLAQASLSTGGSDSTSRWQGGIAGGPRPPRSVDLARTGYHQQKTTKTEPPSPPRWLCCCRQCGDERGVCGLHEPPKKAAMPAPAFAPDAHPDGRYDKRPGNPEDWYSLELPAPTKPVLTRNCYGTGFDLTWTPMEAVGKPRKVPAGKGKHSALEYDLRCPKCGAERTSRNRVKRYQKPRRKRLPTAGPEMSSHTQVAARDIDFTITTLDRYGNLVAHSPFYEDPPGSGYFRLRTPEDPVQEQRTFGLVCDEALERIARDIDRMKLAEQSDALDWFPGWLRERLVPLADTFPRAILPEDLDALTKSQAASGIIKTVEKWKRGSRGRGRTKATEKRSRELANRLARQLTMNGHALSGRTWRTLLDAARKGRRREVTEMSKRLAEILSRYPQK